MKYWIISDTHFYHKNIVEYENRPVNFTDLIIENWKKLVSPEDIVIHLGDVIFGQQSKLKEIMDSLPGTKILVRGNHDKNTDSWYMKRGFREVRNWLGLFRLDGKDILFTHAPTADFTKMIFSFANPGYYEKPICYYNIHGHLHSRRDLLSKYDFYSDKHKLFSLEEWNYRPVLLDEFMEVNKCKS